MYKHRNRHHFGAETAPATATPTVTGTVKTLVHVATIPVKLALNTAGGLVSWVGNTLHGVANKL